MAVFPRVLSSDYEVSMEEFKKWLKQFDKDKDGRINVEELREAIRATGGWWLCKLKATRVVKSVDKNFNGVIDDNEINMLIVFAQKQFGLKVVPY